MYLKMIFNILKESLSPLELLISSTVVLKYYVIF
jgi:hypothetical protein